MNRHDDVREAVRDSFSSWLSQHPVSVPEIIQLAVKEAVTEYLNRNGLPQMEELRDLLDERTENDEIIKELIGQGLLVKEEME